jgi:hypothetical protein
MVAQLFLSTTTLQHDELPPLRHRSDRPAARAARSAVDGLAKFGRQSARAATSPRSRPPLPDLSAIASWKCGSTGCELFTVYARTCTCTPCHAPTGVLYKDESWFPSPAAVRRTSRHSCVSLLMATGGYSSASSRQCRRR